MKTILIIIAILVVIAVIVIFAYKASSERKAKQTYKPPVPSKKTLLPEIQDEKLPARTEKQLTFCRNCGAPNSTSSSTCSNCGHKLDD